MKDMTRGNISSGLIRFSIPLVLGNLFQLTYNAVDSIVVGRFAGEEALAAVGDMGVFGAALSTVIAETVSAVLCISYIYKKVPLLKLKPKEFRMDRAFH